MDPVTIIQGLVEAAKAAKELYDDWQAGRAVLSDEQAQSVHEALVQAEQATAALRPLVDASLAAAAKR